MAKVKVIKNARRVLSAVFDSTGNLAESAAFSTLTVKQASQFSAEKQKHKLDQKRIAWEAKAVAKQALLTNPSDS